MDFEILTKPAEIETIARGNSIREIARLRKCHGKGRWMKRKGIARIKLPGQAPCMAEIHWYEAHGIGKREFKIKRFLGV